MLRHCIVLLSIGTCTSSPSIRGWPSRIGLRTDAKQSLQLVQLGAWRRVEEQGLKNISDGETIAEGDLSLLSTQSYTSLVSFIARTARRSDDVEYPKLNLVSWDLPQGESMAKLNWQPIASCATSFSKDHASAEARNLDGAVQTFCDSGLGTQVEFYVDPKFAANYESAKSQEDWIPEAFVTYIAVKDSGDNLKRVNLAQEVDLLVQSVHHFSSRPVIVANFGNWLPEEWTPERFPRMILVHGNAVPLGKSFNFNKLKAMMFTKVKVGIVLDADQWINSGTDYMFGRAAAEGGTAYPFPILPVHWMSRDPESSDMKGYPDFYAWNWLSTQPPARTMRWGHAHPTWTHDAIGFLAKWTAWSLGDPRKPTWSGPRWLGQEIMLRHFEDEDLLNVALWAENKTKQWCKFDIPGMSDFGKYLSRSSGPLLFPDSKYFPRGIPLVFFTAHDAKDAGKSWQWLQKLWSAPELPLAPILYRGSWFRSGAELAASYPELRCVA